MPLSCAIPAATSGGCVANRIVIGMILCPSHLMTLTEVFILITLDLRSGPARAGVPPHVFAKLLSAHKADFAVRWEFQKKIYKACTSRTCSNEIYIHGIIGCMGADIIRGIGEVIAVHVGDAGTGRHVFCEELVGHDVRDRSDLWLVCRFINIGQNGRSVMVPCNASRKPG